MIPDKIYIRHYWMPEELDDDWRLKPVEDEQCEEYIRKDALLEKLEKVAASYKKRSDEGELVWQNMCGINEAIEILNSI